MHAMLHAGCLCVWVYRVLVQHASRLQRLQQAEAASLFYSSSWAESGTVREGDRSCARRMLSDADALFVEEDYEGAVAAYSNVSAGAVCATR